MDDDADTPSRFTPRAGPETGPCSEAPIDLHCLLARKRAMVGLIKMPIRGSSASFWERRGRGRWLWGIAPIIDGVAAHRLRHCVLMAPDSAAPAEFDRQVQRRLEAAGTYSVGACDIQRRAMVHRGA
jgi:hypothetical protein